MSYLIIVLIVIASVSSAFLVGTSQLNITKYEVKIKESEILGDFNTFETAIESYKKGLNIYPSNNNWESDLKRLNLRIPPNDGSYTYKYEPSPTPALEKVGVCYSGVINKDKFESIAKIHLKGNTVLSEDCFDLEDSEIDFSAAEVNFAMTKWVKINWQSVNSLATPEVVLFNFYNEQDNPSTPNPPSQPSGGGTIPPDTGDGGTGGGDSGGSPTPTPTPTPTCIENYELKARILNGENVETVDTSCITDFTSMFEDVDNFNQDLSNWDVSNATTFRRMFKNAKNFNGNVSNWNTSNVNDFYEIFYKADGLNADISNWNTSKVTNFYRAFRDVEDFNKDISNWNVSSGTQFNQMFRNNHIFNQDLSNWDVSNGRTFKNMFHNAREFNADLSKWDMSNSINLALMFKRAYKFNSDISSWDLSKVTSLNSMFMFAFDFNQDISTWNTGNIRNFHNMFQNATSFNQDISGWDTTLANRWRNFNFYSGLPNLKIPPKFTTQLLINDVVYVSPFTATEVKNMGMIEPESTSDGIALYTWLEASDFCNALNHWGYDNWYLPSIEELNAVYDTIGSVSNLPYDWSTEYYYWTNTLGVTHHISIDLDNKIQHEEDENDYNHVICVRY